MNKYFTPELETSEYLNFDFCDFFFPAKRQRTEEKIEITTFEPNQNSLNDSMSSQAALQPVKLQGELDDPEIDLTDGPVTVRVDHSTRQFYISNYQKVSVRHQ